MYNHFLSEIQAPVEKNERRLLTLALVTIVVSVLALAVGSFVSAYYGI